jgi:GH24 family phage-related lysozyme (muramidase)
MPLSPEKIALLDNLYGVQAPSPPPPAPFTPPASTMTPIGKIEEGSFLSDVDRALGRATRMGVTGVASILDLPNMVMQGGADITYSGGRAIANALGADLPPRQDINQTLPMPSRTAERLFDYVTKGQYTPRNKLEKVVDTGGQLLASGGGYAKAANILPEIAALAPRTATQLAGFGTAGLGLEAGKEMFPDNPVAQLGMGLLGGITPEATVSVARNAPRVAQNLMSMATGVNPQKLQSFVEAGITPRLGDVTDTNVMKSTQNVLKEVPLSSGVIVKSEENALKQATDILNNAGLSNAKSAAQAGQTVSEGLGNYVAKGKEVIGKLYDNFDKFVPKETMVESRPIGFAISEIAKKPTPELQSIFNKSEAGRLVGNIMRDLSAGNGKLPYEAIKNYRTLIGNNLQDVTMLKTADKAVYSRLYGALSETMRQEATARGKTALDAFNRANAVNKGFIEKVEKQIDPLMRRDDVQELFNKVLTNSKIGGKAQNVMGMLKPQDREIVRGSLIKQMGDDAVNEFDPIRFATKYKGLEPEARAALKSGLKPETAKQFDAAIDSLMLMRDTRNTTNASRSLYGGLSALSGVGAWFDPISTSGILGLGNVTARLFTNDKFIKWLAYAPKGLAKNPVKYMQKLNVIAPQIERKPNMGAPKAIEMKPMAPIALTPEKIKILDDLYFNNKGANDANSIPDSPTTPFQINQGEENMTPQMETTIRKAEGERFKVYKDTVGKRTVGVGFNMDSPNARKVWETAGIKTSFDDVLNGKTPITKADSDALLRVTMETAEKDARKLVPNFDTHPENVQSAIIEMSFQLGKPTLSQFKRTLNAIKKGQYELAAKFLKQSKYATQTPNRVNRIASTLTA